MSQAPSGARPDAARPVREGEELPLEPLRAWFGERLPELLREADGAPLEVEQFPGGFSNLTYLLRLGPRELVLRRPPRGSEVRSAHDMGREHRILKALHDVYPKAPRPLAECEDAAVIGAPFYVMERVRGVILRDGARLPEPALGADTMARLSAALVDGLLELHAVDFEACGLDGLGRPEGYVGRQVAGWAERWRKARSDEVPDVDAAAAWLSGNQPMDGAPALIHNDFKYDNLVLDAALERILAVLDWEMATIGAPLLDVGTSLGYWLDPDDPPAWRNLGFLGLTARPGNLSRAGLLERYARASGRDPGDGVFLYVFGLFKITVIAQQIFARFQRGLTRDPRFAGLGQVVRACGAQARRAIELRRIDGLG
ncbi:MAG: phosphotransferase family protein [Vicinamibacteria bacterium]